MEERGTWTKKIEKEQELEKVELLWMLYIISISTLFLFLLANSETSQKI